MIVDDMYEAWQKRHFAEVWRLGHQLAAQCKGPRRRRYNVGACFLPRRAEIVQHFQQDGASGGLDAVPINFDEYRQTYLEALPRAPMFAYDHLDIAREDFEKLIEVISKSPRRRAAPPHSVPTEVLRLALEPWRRYDGRRRRRPRRPGDEDEDEPPRVELQPRHRLAGDRRGLGHDAEEIDTPITERAFKTILAHIRRVQRVPLIWHHSFTTGLDKHNGKTGFDAKRFIHGLCRVGTSWYKAQLHRAACDAPPPREHGYQRGRNREGALLCQEGLLGRLRRLGISTPLRRT